MQYLKVDQTKIPHRFRTKINGVELTFLIRWNRQSDAYTLDVWDGDGTVIATGRPMLYGRDVFRGLAHPSLSGVGVVMFALSRGACPLEVVTPQNVMDEVKPYLMPRKVQ